MLNFIGQKLRPLGLSKYCQTFIAQTAVFNTIWAFSVVFNMQVAAIALLVSNLLLTITTKQQWLYLSLLTLLGLSIDLILTYLGWLQFSPQTNSQFSLIILWLAFSHFSMAFLQRFELSIKQLSIVSLVGGTFSYYVASLNNAVMINWFTINTLVFLLAWIVILPIAKICYRRLLCAYQTP